MILTSGMYVPALRWRQGEYQALFRLTNEVKDRIVPHITIPEIEYDFEEQRPKKSAQEHVHPFASRYKAKWDKPPAWIGVHKKIVGKPMDDGRDIFSYVFDALRSSEANAIPTIPLGADEATINAVSAIIKTDSLGAAISVQLEDIMKPNLGVRIAGLAKILGISINETDLIIDIGAPNFEPYDTFAKAMVAALGKLSTLDEFRNTVLIGTAIPESFKDIGKGADVIPRHDWMFYCTLIGNMPKDMRHPNYGDYTIVHPEFTPVDMRKIKAAGKVIYTTPASWAVRKGGAFRDNPAQMHAHCASLVSSGNFKGAGFSSGDDYIAKCATHKEGPSNQTRWKDVAINHHITHVLDDLAILGAAP